MTTNGLAVMLALISLAIVFVFVVAWLFDHAESRFSRAADQAEEDARRLMEEANAPIKTVRKVRAVTTENEHV